VGCRRWGVAGTHRFDQFACIVDESKVQKCIARKGLTRYTEVGIQYDSRRDKAIIVKNEVVVSRDFSITDKRFEKVNVV
jgi:hypothetical protein